MENTQIADVLDEIATLLELQQDNQFRVRSYRNAARTVRDLSQRLDDLAKAGKDLSELPNIGRGTAEKIGEVLRTGTCKRLEELRRHVPGGLTTLMKVPGLGPRKAMQLYKELGVQTVDGLKEACEDHRVRDLPGMGDKTEQKILDGIRTLESMSGRFLYGIAADYVGTVGRHLDGIPYVKRWEVAGSFRRRKETIGDLDVLVEADDRAEATDRILELESIADVLSRGEERVSVRLDSGLQIDFRFFEPETFGAALMYFTGSKAHNIAVRKRAVQRGWKLNEYGLFKGERLLAGKTEDSVYRRLKMAWMPPELREDRGEIEAAEQGRLPALIEPGDIRGDLQCHTTASDGANTSDQMARAARRLGYSYLAVTEHSQAVRVANGLDEDRLRKHADAIRELDESLADLWLLAGVEVDILKNGKLDIDEDVLAGLDWVLASVHFNRNMDEKEMTRRLVTAVSSGLVHCLGHPLGRIIGRRDPIRFDVDRVFEACREHGVVVEINAQPDRLDLPDTYCRRALEAGLTFSIATDAHGQSDLDFMPFGVYVARRGWLEKEHVLNTCTVEQLRRKIQRK